MEGKHPSAFVSYSWDDEDHKAWVKDLSARLRADGVDVTLDQWAVVPGDQLTAFMERGIRGSRFVIIVCTPRYKAKSDARSGGVGYEENIITAEVVATQNQRKFIPVLARGEWAESAPTWIIGKHYVDLRGSELPQPRYEDLLVTLQDLREAAPPLGSPALLRSPLRADTEPRTAHARPSPSKDAHPAATTADVRIVELVVDEVTTPRNDGTYGSALYAVPFRLSRFPSPIWEKAFLQAWDRPSQFTIMHRPGIARVRGDRIILDGTTIEEVEKYHKDTLMLAITAANEIENRVIRQREKQAADHAALDDDHRKAVSDAAKRITFE